MSQEAISTPKSPSVFFAGLALFSMFFGAGNIIFPLCLGAASLNEIPVATLGFIFSAVLFPFLGLIAMMFYGGNLTHFLARFGKWPAFFLLFALQMSQGSVGAMPRLVTLMHASAKSFLLDLSLPVFSIIICVIIFLLTIRPQKIIDLLGSILTPLLILTLAVLIGIGVYSAPPAGVASEASIHYFGLGVQMGYQTMDLTAALLFATMIMPHLSKGTSDPKVIKKRMRSASLIAAGLLTLTYIGLGFLASRYSASLGQVAPESLLQTVAYEILGPLGGIVSASAVFLACFTTAISLASVFSSYVKEKLFNERLSNGFSLALVLGTTALVANMGFSGIVGLWGPLLEILYPLLIALSIYNIIKAKRFVSHAV